MKKLSREKQTRVLAMLVEGRSMRAISLVVGINYNTVARLLDLAGTACQRHHDLQVLGY